MKNNNYQYYKEQAREKAVEWQRDCENDNYSYSQLDEWGEYFTILAKRYGLTAEFKENGII